MIRKKLATPRGKPAILVVEDDKEVRDLVASTLTADGHTCVTAASAAEAISLLEDRRLSIILTVLDWHLDKSGVEVIRALRDLHPLMPVIVISGLSSDVLTDSLLEEADQFLPKPFSTMVLRRVTARLIDRAAHTLLPKRAEDILSLENVTAIYIRHAVKLRNNNATLAGEKLGIHRQTVRKAVELESTAELEPPYRRTD